MTAPRITALFDLFDRRVALIDGATGTCLQALQPTSDDFGGPEREGCNEALLLTRPDLVADVHARYFEAGADIVETNTFGGTPLVLAEYGLAERCREINRRGAEVAREVAERFSTEKKPRFVAGSMGPTTCALSVRRSLSFEALVDHYLEQALGLHEGGVDYFLVETCQDTLNLKAALVAIERLFSRGLEKRPIAVSATLDSAGHMLGGQSPASLARTLAPFDLLYLGLNCGAGTLQLAPRLDELATATGARLGLMPNAGLPDENGRYGQMPDDFARDIDSACARGALNLVGGCCGTTPEHIRALAKILDRFTPRPRPKAASSFAPVTSPETATSSATATSWLSGIEAIAIGSTSRPVIAGERSNALGSRKFRELIGAGDFDAAADFARRQLSEGASLIDVAVQQADRDEAEDMERLLARLVPRIRSPLMIDTTNPEVARRALGHSQGKAIVNSANLEGGEARFLKMAQVARQFGAALVVGLIDEAGMAIDLDRKLAIAERALALLEPLGFERGDLYFDALVFPCASADPTYVGAARETVRAIAELKRRFSGVRTALGVSNVSFGLPPAGRALVSRLFFDACTDAGLDLAIANAAAIGRDFSQAPAELVTAARALLDIDRAAPDALDSWQARIAELTAIIRSQTPVTAEPKRAEREQLDPERRVERCVTDGTRDGLNEAIDAAIERGARALDLVNGALMRGMDEVGRRFNAGERIVAEVLQSAEVMKAAIDRLEPLMIDGEKATSRGRLLLATVKGDVHDIGKNLVSMIFAGNGFEVVDLGIKVEDEVIVREALSQKPDVIGLSGLLVKSALQMIETARALADAGVTCPLMVGGAALNQAFVERKLRPVYPGEVLYARDAMHGLSLAREILSTGAVEGEVSARAAGGSPDKSDQPDSSKAQPSMSDCARQTEIDVFPEREGERARGDSEGEREESTRATSGTFETTGPLPEPPDSLPARIDRLPEPPDFERHLAAIELPEIWARLNQAMLYGRHLGLSGTFIGHVDDMDEAALSQQSPQALAMRRQIAELKALLDERHLQPRAVHRFVRATRHGDDLCLCAGDIERWAHFPRVDGRSIADFVAPFADSIALFAVTVGSGVTDLCAELRDCGEFVKVHLVQSLALAMAEAAAEWVHARARADWGLEPWRPLLDATERRALLRGQYRGARFSPGYRACPDLALQRLLFDFLDPRDIGLELTESWMMHPEASVSGLVVHHPAASRTPHP